MEWDEPLVKRSLETGKCEFCDNSTDPRPIFDHMLEVHRPNDGGQRVQSGKGPGVGSVPVRAHSRKRPRT